MNKKAILPLGFEISLASSEPASVQVIPTEKLVDAEFFKVAINGVQGSWASDNLDGQNNVGFFVPRGDSTVEIFGNRVLPEFATPVFLFLTVASVSLGILLVRRK